VKKVDNALKEGLANLVTNSNMKALSVRGGWIDRRSRAPTGDFTMAFGHGHPLVFIDFIAQNLIQATKKKLKCDLREVTETKQNKTLIKKVFDQNKSQNLIQTTF
jgi:hypothetical protein